MLFKACENAAGNAAKNPYPSVRCVDVCRAEEKIDDPETRSRYAYREALVSIAGNIGLAAAKILIGMMVFSVAIIADGVHTMSDVGTSFIVILGAKASKKAPDSEHPFGHGRYEYIASLVIYLALIAVGIELLITSVGRVLDRSEPAIGGLTIPAYAVLMAGILVKEAMARYSFSLAKKTDSNMLRGDGWHHRSDALTTIGVLMGIFLVQAGFPLADALIGMGISLFIAFTGAKMAFDTAAVLAGKNASPEKIREIERAARSVDGVLGVHKIFVHDYRNNRVTTLHVEVDGQTGTDYAHRIASEVEKAVSGVVNGETVVHTEPTGPVLNRDVEKALEKILIESPEVKGHHNIHAYFDERGGHVSAHITVRKDMSVEESHRLTHSIDERLKEKYPEYRVELHIEPR